MSCRPSGRPSAVSPAGTEIPGSPARFTGTVKTIANASWVIRDDSTSADVTFTGVRVGAEALLGGDGSAKLTLDNSYTSLAAANDWDVATTVNEIKAAANERRYYIDIGGAPIR